MNMRFVMTVEPQVTFLGVTQFQVHEKVKNIDNTKSSKLVTYSKDNLVASCYSEKIIHSENITCLTLS